MEVLFLLLSPWILYKGFSKPSYFVLLFIAFSMCRLQDMLPAISSYPLAFILASLAILSLFNQITLNKMTLFWTKEMNYFGLFFLWITLGVLLSYNFTLAFDGWYNFATKTVVGFLLIIWTLKDKRDYSWLMIIILFSGIMASLIVIYYKHFGIGLLEGRANIGVGVIGDPNDLSLFLLIPFSIAINALFSTYLPAILRFIGLISSVIIVFAIAATQSRGGLLGLTAICAFFIYQQSKSIKLVLALGLPLVLFLYIYSNVGHRAFDQANLDDSAQYRLEAWKAAIMMAIHHPLFGVGLNNFSDNFFSYAGGIVKSDMVAHSIWFTILAETGFIGFLLYINVIYLFFKSINETINTLKNANTTLIDKNIFLTMAYSVLYSLIGFCIAGSFLSQAYSWFFYTLFAIGISLSHNTKLLLGQTSEKNVELASPHPPFGHLLPKSGEKEQMKEVQFDQLRN